MANTKLKLKPLVWYDLLVYKRTYKMMMLTYNEALDLCDFKFVDDDCNDEFKTRYKISEVNRFIKNGSWRIKSLHNTMLSDDLFVI
jgi:hypothetical protein